MSAVRRQSAITTARQIDQFDVKQLCSHNLDQLYLTSILYNPHEGGTGSSQRFHCNIRLVSSVLKVFISAWGENSEVLGFRHLK